MVAYWNSPEITGVRREPMLNLIHQEEISLDGVWDFQLLANPNLFPSETIFADAGANTTAQVKSLSAQLENNWSSIKVPGLWTIDNGESKFGDKPIYTNVQMPYDEMPPAVPGENPTGIYRRYFDLPENWSGKRIVFQLGAAESVAIVYLNGAEAGMAKDSHLHSEFDVTDLVRSGKNELIIKVVKWSDANYVEDQDQWWHGGISRSVKLYATPQTHLAKLYLTPNLAKDNKTGVIRIRAQVSNPKGESADGYLVKIVIKDPVAKKTVFTKELPVGASALAKDIFGPAEREIAMRFFRGDVWDGSWNKKEWEVLKQASRPDPGAVDETFEIPNIKPWSAEIPNRYQVEVEVLNPARKAVEKFELYTGFRRSEVVGKDYLFNGKRIFIHGVNRHDFHPLTGRVVSAADIRADLVALKKINVNAIRTSHYPNDPALLDLADEMGFYVIEEANIETHDFQDTLCNDPRYLTTWVDRTARMVQRDIHHPSVIFWSLGNESGAGLNHRAAASWVRSFDPSRPLHYEGAIRGNWTLNFDLTDLVCPMYPSIAAIKSYGKSAKAKRPLIMCEYSHAMGNSNGTLKEYWEVIESTPGLQGGFIWEMWDHGLLQKRSGEKDRYAYGGDFGERKHDGNFVCDGLFWPDRTPKPATAELRNIASPVRVTAAVASANELKIKVSNLRFFKPAKDVRILWELLDNGTVVKSGESKLPEILARKNATLTLDKKIAKYLKSSGEIRVAIKLICPNSHDLIADFGFLLQKGKSGLAKRSNAGADYLNNWVDQSGNLKLPLSDHEALSLFRAPTDNDIFGFIAPKWEKWGLAELTLEKQKCRREKGKVTISSTWSTKAGIKITAKRNITSVEKGISIEDEINIPKVLSDLPRIGWQFKLDPKWNSFTYYGSGPAETYPDRKLSPIATYNSTIQEQYVDYIKPQESGGHNEVRWFKLAKASGETLTFTFDQPRQVSALPYSPATYAATGHNLDLKDDGFNYLMVDLAHRGVGTASCGPDTLSEYLILPGIARMKWQIQAE